MERKKFKRITGRIKVEEVYAGEQTRGPFILEIINRSSQTIIKCELKEFHIEAGLSPDLMTEIPPLNILSEIDFNWNLQGKLRFGRIKHFTSKFLKKVASKKKQIVI